MFDWPCMPSSWRGFSSTPDSAAVLNDLHADALELLDEAQENASQAQPPMSLEEAAGDYFGATVDELRADHTSSSQRKEIERLAAQVRVTHVERLLVQASMLRRETVEPLLAHLLAEAAQRLAEAHAARYDWHAGRYEYGRWARAGNRAYAQERRAEADARASGRFSVKRRTAQADAERHAAQGRQHWKQADAVGLAAMIDDALASEARSVVAMLKAVHCAAQSVTSDGLVDEVTKVLGDTEAELTSRVSTLRRSGTPDAVSRLSTELRLLRETSLVHRRRP